MRVNKSERANINKTNNIFLYINIDPLNIFGKYPASGLKEK
jgi:hypothetical protein